MLPNKLAQRSGGGRGVSTRLVMLGALLPNLLDRTLGLWPAPEIISPTSRMFAHTLLFAVLLFVFT